MVEMRGTAVLVLAGTLAMAGCGARGAGEVAYRVEPPPRTWHSADLESVRGPGEARADSAWSARQPGVYPAEREELARPVFRRPLARWVALEARAERVLVLRAVERVLAGLPPVGGAVPLRRGVWPYEARLLARDDAEGGASRVVIATPWVALGALDAEEVVCAEAARGARVRLRAEVEPDSVPARGVWVSARYDVEGAAGCTGSAVAADRVRGYATDLVVHLYRAAARAVPAPVR